MMSDGGSGALVSGMRTSCSAICSSVTKARSKSMSLNTFGICRISAPQVLPLSGLCVAKVYLEESQTHAHVLFVVGRVSRTIGTTFVLLGSYQWVLGTGRSLSVSKVRK